MQPAVYCTEKAAPEGSSLYYAVLFYPPQYRRRLIALFALAEELDSTLVDCRDPGVARMKFQWWHEEIERLFSERPRHPVSRELHELRDGMLLDRDDFFRLIDSRMKQVSLLPPATLADLIDSRGPGTVSSWRMAAANSGMEDAGALDALDELAMVYGGFQFLLSAPQQLQQGYIPYPLADMEQAGLSESTLLEPLQRSALGRLHASLFSALHGKLTRGIAALARRAGSTALFAVVLARIAALRCRRLAENASVDPFQPAGITPLRKLWIAWRSHRGL